MIIRPGHLFGALAVGLSLAPILMEAWRFTPHALGVVAIGVMLYLEFRR